MVAVTASTWAASWAAKSLEVAERAAGQHVEAERGGVGVGLEQFEGQRVVEDLQVAVERPGGAAAGPGAGEAAGGGGEGGVGEGGEDQRAGGPGDGALQQAAAGVGAAQGAVQGLVEGVRHGG